MKLITKIEIKQFPMKAEHNGLVHLPAIINARTVTKIMSYIFYSHCLV